MAVSRIAYSRLEAPDKYALVEVEVNERKETRTKEDEPRMGVTLLIIGFILAVTVDARHKKLNPPMPVVPPGLRTGSPCDSVIPGDWTGFTDHPLNDLYGLAWTQPPSPGAWTATMLQGGGWTTGAALFGPNNLTASISFDSGVNLTGTGWYLIYCYCRYLD